jgi:tetratricopeptide (TPR) repeat protein
MKRAILVVILVLGGPAQASDTSAAQAHARKANSLAAAGKCKQAVPQYDAAYKKLKDPALLFNRAECLRKLGRGAQALHDYQKFLEELPAAPNRSLVESRIGALDPSLVVPKRIVQAAAPVEAPAPLPVVPPDPEPSLHAAAMRTPLPVAAEPPPPVAPEPMLVARPAPPEAPATDRRAWLWLSVAAAVVAASAGGALYLTGRPRNP